MPVESFSVAEPVLEGLIDFVGMGISKRAENCLTQIWIDRLEFLLRMTADDIHKMPCAGAKTVMELMEIIAKLKQEAFFTAEKLGTVERCMCLARAGRRHYDGWIVRFRMRSGTLGGVSNH